MRLKRTCRELLNGWNRSAVEPLKLYKLASGGELPFLSHGEDAVLKSSGLEILCKTFKNEGNIIGGDGKKIAGKDTAKVVFSECVVKGPKGEEFAKCKVMSKPSKAEEEGGATLPPFGTIELKVKTELVYTGTGPQAEKEEPPVGDLFAPASGARFVLLAFEGECPISTPAEVAVEGTTVARITPEANQFPEEEGLLHFEEPASKVTWRWEGPGKVKELKNGLKLFGLPATFIALAWDQARAELKRNRA